MTAPDDVRARFDTWHDQRWPEPDNYRHKVDWRSAKHAKWTVWLAAHADLSGEVRELVEAGNRSISAFEALGKAFGVIATARARQECEAALVAQKAALAKFHPTQQETK